LRQISGEHRDRDPGVTGADDVGNFVQSVLTPRHEHELVDPWCELKSEFPTEARRGTGDEST
jgi:hypothetical protein